MCIKSHSLEEPILNRPLFVRRKDIDDSTRIKIGILANNFSRPGLITELADRYEVSRPFVYAQKHEVKRALLVLNKPLEQQSSWEQNVKQLLLYRIRGGVSISKCQDFLEESDCVNTSAGWISETIKSLGDLVGNVLSGWEGKTVFACDEIYMLGDRLVLVTVDPVSSAILSITVCAHLTSDVWQSHWEQLAVKKIEPLSLVGDEGTCLRSAHCNTYNDRLIYQSDTFHLITQRFGKVTTRLERQALCKIEQEYKREEVYINAKNKKNRPKKKQLYIQAQQASHQALNLLSDFKWLYRQISNQLKVVRSDGSIRQRQWAEGEVQAALDLMEQTLDIDLKPQIKLIRKLLPDLFQYLQQAQKIYSMLEKQIPAYILPFYLAFWQYQRQLTNLKKAKEKNRLIKAKQWLLKIMEDYQQQNQQLFENEKQLVFKAMESVVQSSAMAECINSILRPIFNESKGQVSQQTLNLVMYWHNHRVYKKGKRAGKSPFEILTGNKEKIDWRQGIIDLVKTNEKMKKVA